MNSQNIIDSIDFPEGTDMVIVQWNCAKIPSQAEIVAKYAGICATAKKADRVSIRMGMHNTTRNAKGDPIKDPKGWHYTAEYQDKKTKSWTTWHHYFNLQPDGSFTVNDTQAENPEFWPNRNGKPSTKVNAGAAPVPGKGKSKSDKVWAWKKGGQQYVRLQPL